MNKSDCAAQAAQSLLIGCTPGLRFLYLPQFKSEILNLFSLQV